MIASDITLSEEEEWDHVLPLDLLVLRADYGILDASTHLGKRLLLVETNHPEATEETVRYTALQWAPGDGVHYDGDGTMQADHLVRLLRTGEAKATIQWFVCEAFIAPGRHGAVS